MPLERTISSTFGQVGLWRISGHELAEYAAVFGTDAEDMGSRHPRPAMQRAASRLLLAQMLGSIPKVIKQPDGKPILMGDARSVSISHTDGYAAVMLGTGPVSVDVQAITPRIMKLRERFLKPSEQRMAPDPTSATLLWAAKECAYKLQATDRHDFREPITIHGLDGQIISASLRTSAGHWQLELGYTEPTGAQLVWLSDMRDSP